MTRRGGLSSVTARLSRRDESRRGAARSERRRAGPSGRAARGLPPARTASREPDARSGSPGRRREEPPAGTPSRGIAPSSNRGCRGGRPSGRRREGRGPRHAAPPRPPGAGTARRPPVLLGGGDPRLVVGRVPLAAPAAGVPARDREPPPPEAPPRLEYPNPHAPRGGGVLQIVEETGLVFAAGAP